MKNAKVFLNRKVLLAFGMIVFTAAAVAGVTGAFFSDTETSADNVFQADTLDLEVGIDSSSTIGNLSLASLDGNEALFNFQGLIPGESDGGFFKLRANQDAWACMAAEVTSTPENDRLDPETDAGDVTPNIGELQNFLQLATWIDADEDGVYDSGEAGLQVADITDFDGAWMTLMDSTNVLNLDDNVRGEVGFQYCFGTFVDPLDPAAGCDGSNPDTNQAQTDGVEMTMKFIGMQFANNPNFSCGSLNPTIAPQVVLGAADMTSAAGARFRSFNNTGGEEVYAGLHDLGSAAGRVAQNLSWTKPGTHDVTIEYDADTDTIFTTVGTNPTISKSLAGAACTTWDTAQLAVVNRDTGTTVNLNNVDLGGFALGGFSGGTGGDSVDDWQNWTITGFDFTSDFTMTAELELDGAFGNSQELSKVEFLMGCSA